MIYLDNRYNFRQIIDPNNLRKLYVTANVTRLLKSILGDVVVSAQQILYYGENREHDSFLEQTIAEKLVYVEDYNELSLDQGDILIKFINNKVVKISSPNSAGSLDESLGFASLPGTELRASGYSVMKYIKGDYNSNPHVYYTIDVTNKLIEYFGNILEKAEQLIWNTYKSDDSYAIKTARHALELPTVGFECGMVVFRFTDGHIMEINTYGDLCKITESEMIGGGN
jgi:hypothetical protein